MAIHREPLTPLHREYLAMVDAQFRRAERQRDERYAALLRDLGIPLTAHVTIERDAVVYATPDAPPEVPPAPPPNGPAHG